METPSPYPRGFERTWRQPHGYPPGWLVEHVGPEVPEEELVWLGRRGIGDWTGRLHPGGTLFRYASDPRWMTPPDEPWVVFSTRRFERAGEAFQGLSLVEQFIREAGDEDLRRRIVASLDDSPVRGLPVYRGSFVVEEMIYVLEGKAPALGVDRGFGGFTTDLGEMEHALALGGATLMAVRAEDLGRLRPAGVTRLPA